MNDSNAETAQREHPIGLYRDPESGQFIGAIDSIQANAFVRVGFKLYSEGMEAAMTTQDELDKLMRGASQPAEPTHSNPSTSSEGLDALARAELEKTATALGVKDADKLPNKQAVIDAINKAKGAN